MRACTASSPLRDPRPRSFPITHDQCSHWLALAGVASFFTQKSRAAILFAGTHDYQMLTVSQRYIRFLARSTLSLRQAFRPRNGAAPLGPK
jgi:hypothetical protein